GSGAFVAGAVLGRDCAGAPPARTPCWARPSAGAAFLAGFSAAGGDGVGACPQCLVGGPKVLVDAMTQLPVVRCRIPLSVAGLLPANPGQRIPCRPGRPVG